MKMVEQKELMIMRAKELARSGNFADSVLVEIELKGEFPKVRQWLSEFDRQQLDEMCKQAQDQQPAKLNFRSATIWVLNEMNRLMLTIAAFTLSCLIASAPASADNGNELLSRCQKALNYIETEAYIESEAGDAMWCLGYLQSFTKINYYYKYIFFLYKLNLTY